MEDFDILKELGKFTQGFAYTETKEEITKKYVEGRITKEEYIRRMKNAN